jgi:hypothetical protein
MLYKGKAAFRTCTVFYDNWDGFWARLPQQTSRPYVTGCIVCQKACLVTAGNIQLIIPSVEKYPPERLLNPTLDS